MSVLASIGTGNWLTAGTWGLVNAASYLNEENVTESNLTTAYSGTRSSTFTPGAVTISHIGVKLCERITTVGTISVSLRNATIGLDDFVAGTEVTINTADLPSCLEVDLNGGWVFFKLAAPVLLLAATLYNVQAKVSSAGSIDLWTDAVVDNLSRALVTTTTQAPVAGDDVIVAGEYTGAGTSNSFTITIDEVATTDYGAAPTAANSLIKPGIAVCSKGTLSVGTTAATNYNLKLSNSLIVYSGGILNFGTTGTPIPRDSSFTLQFDPGTNVDYGLTIRNLGTWNSQGLSRTVAKDIYYCKLNTDEAIAQTTLGVDTDTGWLDNDQIVVASTTRTPSQTELGALNGAAGASTLTVDGFAGAGGGLAFAHSGTAPTQAEVINLTRNVVIRGASATLQAYIVLQASSVVDVDWTEFKWLGSASGSLRGIYVNTTTGSCSFRYCSIHDCVVSGSYGFTVGSSSGNNIVFSNNVSYNIHSFHISNITTSGTQVYDGNIMMVNSSLAIASFGGVNNVTITNNVFVGCNSVSSGALTLNDSISTAFLGTISNNTCHSSAGYGLFTSSASNGLVLSNFIIWRNATAGYSYNNTGATITGCLFSNFIFFGNGASVMISSMVLYDCTFENMVSNSEASFGSSAAFVISSLTGLAHIKIINGDFSTVSGIKTAHPIDISLSSACNAAIYLINTKLGAATPISNTSNLLLGSYVASQKHNQVAGSHRTYLRYGTLATETTTVHTGSQSLKMTPNNASNKLQSIGQFGGFKVQVNSGQTCTPTIYVFEDASYNGARARLYVRRNDALGITADTLLDTATAASDAAWEALTGSTAAVTDDGVLEFYVDCDGTAGNLFVDSFTAINA